MKKVMIGVALSGLFLLTGCPSGKGLCKSGIDLACTRFHECADDATKTAAATVWGTDVDDCKSIQEAADDCDLIGNKDQNCAAPCESDTDCTDPETCDTDAKRCTSNLEYGLGQASKCKKGTEAQSCADFLDPMKWSDACADSSGNNLVCTTG